MKQSINSLYKEELARKQGYAEGIRFTAKSYSAVVLLCLKDKFDFNTEQLQEVAKHISNTFDSVCEGYLSLQDIEQTLDEENDIEIRFGTNPIVEEKTLVARNQYHKRFAESVYKGGAINDSLLHGLGVEIDTKLLDIRHSANSKEDLIKRLTEEGYLEESEHIDE
jgi:hypothetical protein